MTELPPEDRKDTDASILPEAGFVQQSERFGAQERGTGPEDESTPVSHPDLAFQALDEATSDEGFPDQYRFKRDPRQAQAFGALVQLVLKYNGWVPHIFSVNKHLKDRDIDFAFSPEDFERSAEDAKSIADEIVSPARPPRPKRTPGDTSSAYTRANEMWRRRAPADRPDESTTHADEIIAAPTPKQPEQQLPHIIPAEVPAEGRKPTRTRKSKKANALPPEGGLLPIRSFIETLDAESLGQGIIDMRHMAEVTEPLTGPDAYRVRSMQILSKDTVETARGGQVGLNAGQQQILNALILTKGNNIGPKDMARYLGTTPAEAKRQVIKLAGLLNGKSAPKLSTRRSTRIIHVSSSPDNKWGAYMPPEVEIIDKRTEAELTSAPVALFSLVSYLRTRNSDQLQ